VVWKPHSRKQQLALEKSLTRMHLREKHRRRCVWVRFGQVVVGWGNGLIGCGASATPMNGAAMGPAALMAESCFETVTRVPPV